ncbi:GSCFA domain-containing protein [Peribacillus kribbensis]|uniref:GSCFA domain-containing protein n=1 Tax=Peribacillus kribbensis TaxID=356658 RepID=UPI00040A1E39|nr:GSCFA domain-containing protein [Peribacillus kribbensis]
MKKTVTYLILGILYISSWFMFFPGSEIQKSPHPAKNSPAGPVPQILHIIAAGDSLTRGVGSTSKEGGYIPYVKERIEADSIHTEIVNHGITGSRSDQLLQQISQQSFRHELRSADVVILTIGGNDIMKILKKNLSNLKLQMFERERKEYVFRLSQILSKIRAANIHADIYVLGIYNPFMKWSGSVKELDMIVEEWNEATRSGVREFEKSYYIPINDIFMKNTGEELLYQNDHFHPNDKGYKYIGERVYQSIREHTLSTPGW